MGINEKAAYIKGMIDGMDLDKNDKTVRVLNAVVDLLSEVTEKVSDLNNAYDELCEQVDEIDEDLASIEEDYYEDFEDDDDDYVDEDDNFYEVTCPSCGETTYMDENTLLEGSISCPSAVKNLSSIIPTSMIQMMIAPIVTMMRTRSNSLTLLRTK